METWSQQQILIWGVGAKRRRHRWNLQQLQALLSQICVSTAQTPRACSQSPRRSRCCPKLCQTRRVAPVVALLQSSHATQDGAILGATFRAGAIFPQSCVAVRYGRLTNVRSLRLVLQKNGRQRAVVLIVNTP